MAFWSGLPFRRNIQVVSMDSYSPDHDPIHLFHSCLAEHLLPLHPSNNNNTLPLPEEEEEGQQQQQPQPQHKEEHEEGDYDHHNYLLTLPFLRKLLDALLLCDSDFVSLLPFLSQSSSSPFFRTNNPLPALFLRSLDILNAVSDALESLRSSLRLARIASSSLPHQPQRSRHALSKLLPSLDPRPAASAPRAWSLGRSSQHRGGGEGSEGGRSSSSSSSRSLSLRLRGDWSAARQLQAMAGMLQNARGGEETAVYAMGSMLVLAMWCLVAAFPAAGGVGDREEAVRVPAAPRQIPWGATAAAVVERVGVEWRRSGREWWGGWWWSLSSSSMPAGMLGELRTMERLGKVMMEKEEEEVECEEATCAAAGLAEVCREAEGEVARLQAVVREVFHRMVRSRAKVMEVVHKGRFFVNSDGSSTPVAV